MHKAAMLTSSLAILLLLPSTSSGASILPAMFILGDSLVDPGNNNRLVTLAKANYAPYGVDFPAGVTGRFCNGGTVADHLGELLGLPLIPPFTSPSSSPSKEFVGVNYASAASGILNDTGKLYGALFTMEQQIQNFQKTVDELKTLMGERASELIDNSLILVCMGSNDYINNYLLPLSDKRKTYSPAAYAQLLMHHYSRQLMKLYWAGGRRFLISGVGPLGCIPNQIGSAGGNSSACVSSTNMLARQFNANLRSMLRHLDGTLPGSRFLFWDTYSSSWDIINNFSLYGFRYAHTACCGVGREKGKVACLPLLECANRSEFIFWDPFHPSDAFNAIAAARAFDGRLQRRSPVNVRQLVQLRL